MNRRELKKRISILMTVVLAALIMQNSFCSSAYIAVSNERQNGSTVLPDGEVGKEFPYADDEATGSDYAENNDALSEATPSVATPSVYIYNVSGRKMEIVLDDMNGSDTGYFFTDYGKEIPENELASNPGTMIFTDASMIIDPAEHGYGDVPCRIYVFPMKNHVMSGDYCYIDDPINMESVTASVKAGHVSRGTEVMLSTTDPEKYGIRYTTDGNTPDMSSVLYTQPIIIEDDTVIKAITEPKDPDMTYENGWYGGGFSTYAYYTGNVTDDRFEPDDSVEAAAELSFPGRYSAMISYSSDLDFYKFELTEKASLDISLSEPAGVHYGLQLLNADGEIIQSNTLSRGKNIIATDSNAGTYYVKVYSVDGTCTDRSEYDLRLYQKYDNAENAKDFSEANMIASWFGDAGGQQTAYTGLHGRDVSDGGSAMNALDYYSLWYGPVNEAQDPYWSDADKNNPKYYKSLGKTSAYHLQAAISVPSHDEVEKGNMSEDDFRAHVKNLIYTYGAADAGFMAYRPYFTASYSDYYMDEAQAYKCSPKGKWTGGGHAVTFIGWDDNYPKENFGRDSYWLKHYRFPDEDKPVQPKGNGAWICKNSWGTKSGYDGYFYISYECTESLDVNPTVFLMEEGNKNYNRQYANDICAGPWHISGPGTGIFENVFTSDGKQQLLKAVSEIVYAENQHYTFYVTVNGEKTKIAEGSNKYAGYYTHRLEKPVLIPANTDFSITEEIYSDTGEYGIGATYNQGAEVENRAYFYDPNTGTRKSMSKDKCYPSIRAFTLIPGETDYEVYVQSAAAASAGNQASESLQTGDFDITPVVNEEADPEGYGLQESRISYSASPIDITGLPEKFDLRSIGAVSPVKNQGAYGACWAFGACASAESNVLLNQDYRQDYDRTMTLTSDPGTSDILLTAAEPERTVSMQADIQGKAGDGNSVYWYVTGDTDSVTMLNDKSESGEDIQVFKFTKPGTVTVTASAGVDINATETRTFTATDDGITSITLDREKLGLKVGDTYTLTASILPEESSGKTILWSSSDPDVAYADKNGKVTALKAGQAVITVRSSNVSAQCTVTVGSISDNGTGSGSVSRNSDSGIDYTDPVKGHMNTLTGILTGSGSGFSRWISITNPETGTVTWKLQYVNGTNAAGTWEKVNGKWYKFDASGTMQTGWVLDNGKWYYLDPVNGDMKTGYIQASDGYGYYFWPDGSMAAGDVEIDGVRHQFNSQLPPGPTYDRNPITGEWKPNGSNAIPYGAEIK